MQLVIKAGDANCISSSSGSCLRISAVTLDFGVTASMAWHAHTYSITNTHCRWCKAAAESGVKVMVGRVQRKELAANHAPRPV